MRAPHSHFRKALFYAALIHLVAVLGLSSALGALRYVSPTGADTNSGSMSSPWRTIQKAATTALEGDTVNIRSGIYAERVVPSRSGNTTSGFITFQSYPGETAIIDGSTLTPTTGQETALIRIDNKSRLIFRDLEIRGYKNILANNASIAGIMLLGTSSHIEFHNCKVHSIEGAFPANGSTNGIAVYGRNATAISNIIFEGCQIYNLKTRDSESFVVNGNVDGFRISNCTVRDCNNIGIDIIGHEGTNSNPALDQARNGVIRGNHVYNIDTLLNPDYLDRTAGGIYVDGGRDLIIEQNRVHHCNIGIEIASENAGKTASNCIVRNNFVYLNELVGIYMGGSGAGNGGVTNCQFLHNTIFCNDTLRTGSGQIELQHNVSNVTFKHNLIYAGAFNSRNDLFRDREAGSTGIVLNYNLYWVGVAEGNQGAFGWQSIYITGFNNWKTQSGQDAQSLFLTPQLVNTASEATLDLHLLAASPARNAGETTFVPQLGEIEIDGHTRVAETRVDIGADEFVPTVSIAGIDTTAEEWLATTATFTLTRSAGNTVLAPLNVSLTNAGTATDGVDFPTLLSATIPAGQTSTTLTLTPVGDALAEGPETVVWSVVTTPGAVINGSVSPVTITIADRPLQQWKWTNFGLNANSPSIAGDAMDGDQDGVPNIVEYAIGTNPLIRNTAQPFTITTISPQLTATLTRPTKPVDVTLTGEISSNLTTWLGTPAIVEMTNSATTYTFRDATPVTANPKRFVRLRATP